MLMQKQLTWSCKHQPLDVLSNMHYDPRMPFNLIQSQFKWSTWSTSSNGHKMSIQSTFILNTIITYLSVHNGKTWALFIRHLVKSHACQIQFKHWIDNYRESPLMKLNKKWRHVNLKNVKVFQKENLHNIFFFFFLWRL